MVVTRVTCVIGDDVVVGDVDKYTGEGIGQASVIRDSVVVGSPKVDGLPTV